ncbi:EAL domain-containing protein [Citrobacter cronae]|uniref:EAL domain-containing protein n=1 Tax=Citrobacter cronae TaxID=1748967 RepID=UPI0021D311E1|nr:EAL domain-containing protein [Citrobacter cronae]MCU6172998.1 EAL domain-containing protein [Citrobacter cronae]
MSHYLYLSDNILNAAYLPDSLVQPGEYHLAASFPTGMKAEPLMNLHSGRITGYEFLSVLPAGMDNETFFRHLSATAITELFLLQLILSNGLKTGVRFLNLPIRVLTNTSLCKVLVARCLQNVVVEIQDPEQLMTLDRQKLFTLRHNLYGFRQAGAGIYADDVTPELMRALPGMLLPLSGIKVSRQLFQNGCLHHGIPDNLTEWKEKDGMNMVAEGIETKEQCLLAALAGFTHGQGWLWPVLEWRYCQTVKSGGE